MKKTADPTAVPDLGEPILFPTDFRPHLCVARRKKDEKPQAEHGVQFVRSGDDLFVHATDNRLSVRLQLQGQGHLTPELGCVVPAKAMRLIAQAEDEQAALWFGKGKVHIRFDGQQHTFGLVDVLPYKLEDSGLFKDVALVGRKVSDCRINGAQLARLQKSLGADWVELRQRKKGAVLIVPHGEVGVRLGALSLYNSIEGDEAKGE